MEALSYAGAIRQFARFARERSIPIESILDADLKKVLAASVVADRVPAHAIVDMLQLCSSRTNHPDLGVSLAAWANVCGGFGPLSLVWQYSPTLAETIRVNRRFIHTENFAVGFDIANEEDEFVLQHLLMVPTQYGGSQFIEASLALDVRVARIVLGDEQWSPVRIELTHSAPSNTRVQRAFFRCPVEFGAYRNAIVIKRSDLMRPALHGNEQMFSYLERHIEAANNGAPIDLPHRVSELIAVRLIKGEATLEHVARDLAMSPRTLQRQLAEHQLAFASLLVEVRKRVAEEYFRSERRANLTELAYRLGYSDNSAASRYLRTNLHMGARALRVCKKVDREVVLAD